MGDTESRVAASEQLIGWAFVGVQAILFLALVLVPRSGDWTVPSWLQVVALAAIVAGLAVAVVAILGLGQSLSPVPIPTERGSLRTDGLYRWVRHPIYTGVLLVAFGVAARSGSYLVVGVAVALVVFFAVKANWEEQRLVERYPEYPAYAATTPAFVPRPRLPQRPASPDEG